MLQKVGYTVGLVAIAELTSTTGLPMAIRFGRGRKNEVHETYPIHINSLYIYTSSYIVYEYNEAARLKKVIKIQGIILFVSS